MPITFQAPTPDEVDAIAALTDATARNRRITASYHALSAAIAERASPGANWCTFAAWASRQAGQTIRGEDLAAAADTLLVAPAVRQQVQRALSLASMLAHDPISDAIRAEAHRVLRRAADAVAAGNRKVFAEIGREFARWVASDASGVAAFGQSLRDGDPPDGQRLLRVAFAAYAETCATTDPKGRAERLLLGNLLVGMHEQTRLQPEIVAALDAALPAASFRDDLLAALLPGPWLRLRARIARALGRPLPLDVAIDALVDAVQRALRVTLTQTLMTLRMPDGVVLHLSRDLDGAYPPELTTLELAPLRALVARVDPNPLGAAGSGAVDWADLSERMHFIAELFRCWHARTALFEAPE